MKTLISKYWLVLMALVSVTLFSACSDDDDAVAPAFPQLQTIAGEAGKEYEFTFEVNDNWSLSSNKMWCQIAEAGNNDNSENAKAAAKGGFVLNGAAGKHTIKVIVTDDEKSYDLSVAMLNMKMGGQEMTVAEVTRSAAGYELAVYDELGNDITQTGITVGYKDLVNQPVFTKFTVKANYRFTVTETPAWVQLEGGFLVGTPGKAVESGASFQENSIVSPKYPISKEANYFITFASEDGKAIVTVPVTFNGMTAESINFTYPSSSKWPVWDVSLDGKEFVQNGTTLTGSESTKVTYHNFVPFTINSFADAYQLVVFENSANGLMENADAVQLKGEKGNVKLTVAPLASGSRELLVYVLPQKVYDKLVNEGNGLDDMLENEYTTVSSSYDEYFLMDIMQHGNDGGSTVKSPLVTSMGMDADCALTTNADYKMYAEGLFSYTGNDVFESTVYGGYVAIYPQIDGWDPTAGDGVVIYDGTGNTVDNYEMQMDDKGIYIGFMADELTAPILVGFNDAMHVCKRVVVINKMQ